MLYAVVDSSREIAFANFLMAIFGLFTFGLPLLLISRSNKIEANRDFLYSTINPWYQAYPEVNVQSFPDSNLNINDLLEDNTPPENVINSENFEELNNQNNLESIVRDSIENASLEQINNNTDSNEVLAA